jgi:hypothetical protein
VYDACGVYNMCIQVGRRIKKRQALKRIILCTIQVEYYEKLNGIPSHPHPKSYFHHQYLNSFSLSGLVIVILSCIRRSALAFL